MYAGMRSITAVEDDRLIVGTTQDCDAIVADAQARHREGFHGTSEMRHAARIPLVVVEKYCNDQGIDLAEWGRDRVHIRRMLQDPALAAFRIWPGKVA